MHLQDLQRRVEEHDFIRCEQIPGMEAFALQALAVPCVILAGFLTNGQTEPLGRFVIIDTKALDDTRVGHEGIGTLP